MQAQRLGDVHVLVEQSRLDVNAVAARRDIYRSLDCAQVCVFALLRDKYTAVLNTHKAQACLIEGIGDAVLNSINPLRSQCYRHARQPGRLGRPGVKCVGGGVNIVRRQIGDVLRAGKGIVGQRGQCTTSGDGQIETVGGEGVAVDSAHRTAIEEDAGNVVVRLRCRR